MNHIFLAILGQRYYSGSNELLKFVSYKLTSGTENEVVELALEKINMLGMTYASHILYARIQFKILRQYDIRHESQSLGLNPATY